MEENVHTNTVPSSENSWIPQWAPAGVFVPNDQVAPAQDTPTSTEAPVSQQVETPVVQEQVSVVSEQPVVPIQWTPETAPVAPKEGALEKIFNGLARFIAKISGQPDPITWTANSSAVANKAWNIVGKVWNAANQAVEKAWEVATQATNVVGQATEKIQQVVPPPTAAQPSAPAPEQVWEQAMPEQATMVSEQSVVESPTASVSSASEQPMPQQPNV